MTISVSSFRGAQARSRDTTRKTQVLNMQSAIEQYKGAQSVYAPQYCSYAGGTSGSPAVAGQCYNNTDPVDTYRGGLGNCDYIVTAPGEAAAIRDPAFVVDTASAGAIAASGYLLPYMARPATLPSSINEPGLDTAATAYWPSASANCARRPSSILRKTGRIAYKIHKAYWVQVVLESKNTLRDPAGATCYYYGMPTALLSNVEFRDVVYLAYPYAACGANQYKIFARGNLATPSQ